MLLIIGCLLGSLVTQWLIHNAASRGTFVLTTEDKEDTTDYHMYVSFEEEPQELYIAGTRYIILEKEEEKC